MMAAALIPLMLILGLITLFLAGAWPMAWLPGLTLMALLVGLAIGLSRMLARGDEHQPGH